ncbi:hypothetical protein H0H92_000505 [Tricholoma furcatifolium]|nr:hypothetical protein H0H92_000505 [Tricholoma furcatifolium]
MGSSVSSPGSVEVTVPDTQRQGQTSKDKTAIAGRVKVLLLGSGDSGKTTLLKQMRLLHMPFSPQEIESYRQLIFDNITWGLRFLINAMDGMELEVSKANIKNVDILAKALGGVAEGEPFPTSLYGPLKSLWMDEKVQEAWGRGNEVAVPDNLAYFFSSLDRLFDPAYVPLEQDILRSTARTTGINETELYFKGHQMLIVDEREEEMDKLLPGWDVTSILFFVSLSGYDQCLVEDREEDVMMLWSSICQTPWFKSTSLVCTYLPCGPDVLSTILRKILFLNKSDLFEEKIPSSDIKTFFPDFDGPPRDARAGEDYFKRKFAKIAQTENQLKTREIYIQCVLFDP